MKALDSQSESERLRAHYAQLSDGELNAIGSQYNSLTEQAQSALRAEFGRRNMPAPELAEKESAEFQPLVTIRLYRDLPEAQLAKAALESAGIHASLRDENLVRMDWFYSNAIGRIRLQVPPAEVADAAQVLSQPIPPVIESDSGNYEQPRCPSCQSLDLELPWEQSNAWSCNNCGARWEELPDDQSDAPRP